MIDTTAAIRYKRYFDKEENKLKIYSRRVIQRISYRQATMTMDTDFLLKMFVETQKQFIKSLKSTTEKSQFNTDLKLVSCLDLYLRDIHAKGQTSHPESAFQRGCTELGLTINYDRTLCCEKVKKERIKIMTNHPSYTRKLVAIVLNLGVHN